MDLFILLTIIVLLTAISTFACIVVAANYDRAADRQRETAKTKENPQDR